MIKERPVGDQFWDGNNLIEVRLEKSHCIGCYYFQPTIPKCKSRYNDTGCCSNVNRKNGVIFVKIEEKNEATTEGKTEERTDNL